MNPLRENSLTTRAHIQQAVIDLVSPLDRHASSHGARVLPDHFAATYSQAGAGLEGFARRFWGLAPLAAGGGSYEGWANIRAGLAAGADPSHAEYWGDPGDCDVKLVEMASLGVAMALAKPQLWDPLPADAKRNVLRWIDFANTRQMVGNNWLLFPVMANLGLETIGEPTNDRVVETALAGVESMYLGDGWCSDGLGSRHRDYYVSFAIHYYLLIYAAKSKRIDPKLAQTIRERATTFARDFVYWFSPDGSAIPFGRSMTYRFAQVSFWGALAFAGVEALPWGVIKGILLRHLRWWAQQPIFSECGVLTVGYGYPNLITAEQYNAPGSPYWALKAFLPLALSADHPFWLADELPLPQMDTVKVLPHAYMTMCRDDADGHVYALGTGQWPLKWPSRNAEEKYAKFAYSTAFGFCVDIGQPWADSMLSFNADGRKWFGRSACDESHIDQTTGDQFSKWRPIDGVEVETWLRPRDGNWHVREHRVTVTRRPVNIIEGGFAANAGHGDVVQGRDTEVGEGFAIVRGVGGTSGIRDMSRNRTPVISSIEPNVNLIHPRTLAPLLTATLEPGVHTFATAVLGCVKDDAFRAAWARVPEVKQ